MATYGFVLVSESESAMFESGEWNKLKFYADGEVPVIIHAPRFTYRELRYLEQQLPLQEGRTIQSKGLNQEDVDAFADVYPYYPTYVEVVG